MFFHPYNESQWDPKRSSRQKDIVHMSIIYSKSTEVTQSLLIMNKYIMIYFTLKINQNTG